MLGSPGAQHLLPLPLIGPALAGPILSPPGQVDQQCVLVRQMGYPVESETSDHPKITIRVENYEQRVARSSFLG